MAWLLLFVLTAVVVLLPMLPAIAEWHSPTDVVPLHIDSEDAQDPPFMANSFARQLAAAVAKGQKRLGRSRIAQVSGNGRWPLKDGERRKGQTRRVWHSAGDMDMPDEINFLAEAATPGDLSTAPNRTYRALWSGRRLRLAEGGTVLRWAHGAQVELANGCRVAGRVSADESIMVWGRSHFSLLHAPAVCFATMPDQASAPTSVVAKVAKVVEGDLPEPVVWDDVAQRGVCDGDLTIDDWRAWRGDLVGHGSLTLGTGCRAEGNLKAHGDLATGANCRVSGNLVAEGRVTLGAGSTVGGSVVSEQAVMLGAGCVVGAPGKPATVTAPRIEVGPGVVVHGTLWATERGDTLATAPTRTESRWPINARVRKPAQVTSA